MIKTNFVLKLIDTAVTKDEWDMGFVGYNAM
jgi:hypothetical protein